LWRRRVVPPGGNIEDPDRKLRRRRLVAGEETRSRRRGQHLRSNAGGPRSERYGMEPGMPHLLCFLKHFHCYSAEPTPRSVAFLNGKATQMVVFLYTPTVKNARAARIAQPCDRLKREPGRLKGWGSRFHARVCKIADRLAEYTLHILKQIRGTRRRLLASARLREGRQDRSSHLPFAMGRFVFGPFAFGACVGARE
jgi:hypothetical protein